MTKTEETLIKTQDVLVRILVLAPQEVAPWHYHRAITDNMFCLSGSLEIQLQDPEQTLSLQPGQRCEAPPGRVHRVVNPTEQETRYLLVQGVGNYDFNVVDPD